MGVAALFFCFLMMAGFSLRVASSNVNSVKVRRTRHAVYDHLRYLDADVIFLQETHLTTLGHLREAEREWRSGPSYWSLAVEPYAGVAILFNTTDVTVHRLMEVAMGRCLVLEVTIHGRRLRLINIYGPQTVTERIQLLIEVKQYLFTSIPVVMAGDFNVTLTLGDRSSGRAVVRDSKVLKSIISQANLCDVFTLGGRKPKYTYTWTGAVGLTWLLAVVRDSKVLKSIISQAHLCDVFTLGGRKPKYTYTCADRSSRIDMAFVSPSETVCGMSERVVPYSDHLALFFCMGASNRSDIGRGLWRLNSSILDDVCVQNCVHSLFQDQLQRQDFYDNISDWWENVKEEIRSLLKRLSVKKGKSKYSQYLRLRKELESLYSAGGGGQTKD
ncbi:hypothetical protein GDO81_019635 [Engystomops pustulosus]|uniref:exodeoxyribonuclease III n=1 Tax=Engystomops pustulosus TaxID=76066 RepID=A0AAV6ZJW2_ENGPU|nr:hypothetical protein GDO81_019635 [Engystomops pustulosus]